MRKQHPNALAKCMCGRRPHLTRPFLAPCSGWPPVRKVRRQVPRLRLLRAAVRPRAYLRRVQLRLLSGSLRHLWPAGHLRCLLLQGVHAAGEGRTWRPAPTPAPARIHPRASRLPYSRIERVCAAAARWLSKDRQPGLVEDRPLLRAQKVRLPQEVTAAGAGARTASAPPLEVERGQRRVGTERKKRSPCQPTKGREARVHGCRTPDLRVPQTAPSTINRRTIQRSCDHGVHRCDHTNRDENKSVCWPCRKTSEMGLRRVSETRRAGRARCFALRCRGPDTPSRTRPSRVLACRGFLIECLYTGGREVECFLIECLYTVVLVLLTTYIRIVVRRVDGCAAANSESYCGDLYLSGVCCSRSIVTVSLSKSARRGGGGAGP